MDFTTAFATVVAAYICCVLVASTVHRTYRFFVLMPTTAWCLVLSAALINPLDFHPIHYKTVFAAVSFVLLLCVSTAAAIHFVGATRVRQDANFSVRGSAPAVPIKASFKKWLGIILVAAYAYFALSSFKYIASHGFSSEYRMLAMGYGGESVVFGAPIIQFLFNTLIRGGLMIYLCFSLHEYFIRGSRGPLMLAAVLMATDSVITFGRFFIYIFIFMYLLGAVLYRRPVLGPRTVLVISSAVGGIFLLSSLRFDDGLGVSQFIDRYVIGYHIYGIFLLDHFMMDGIRYSYWYGGATLSGLMYLLSRPLDLIGFEAPYFLGSDTAQQMASHVLLGFDGRIPITANAFYTVITDMLIDGSWVSLVGFSIALGLIYGFLVVKMRSSTSPKWYSLVFLISLVLFFSILKNQFGQVYLMVAALFFILAPSRLYCEFPCRVQHQ